MPGHPVGGLRHRGDAQSLGGVSVEPRVLRRSAELIAGSATTRDRPRSGCFLPVLLDPAIDQRDGLVDRVQVLAAAGGDDLDQPVDPLDVRRTVGQRPRGRRRSHQDSAAWAYFSNGTRSFGSAPSETLRSKTQLYTARVAFRSLCTASLIGRMPSACTQR